MRMFLAALLAMFALGIAADALLQTVQEPVAVAFATPGARVDLVQ